MMPYTPQDVANWILAQVEANGDLYQENAVREIEDQFGDEFVRQNEEGNTVIGKNVLSAFLKITKDTIVWERGERRWRKREPYDRPGRQQD